jgi:glycosyltransferase involved in cell wall biosynthesis
MRDLGWPKISLVTPSFNQGSYIEATIQSVLTQEYPNLEYIIMDGGSSDQTKSILKKYSQQLTFWVSEPDQGQSDAINKGLARCSGDVFNWINSDDQLMPGALKEVGRLWKEHRPQMLSGGCVSVNESDALIYEWKARFPRTPADFFRSEAFVLAQPSTFIDVPLLRSVQGVRSDLHYLMDWELYLRICLSGSEKLRSVVTPKVLSRALQHAQAKTIKNSNVFREEETQILRELRPRLSGSLRQALEECLHMLDTEHAVGSAVAQSRPLQKLLLLPFQQPIVLRSRFYWGALRQVLRMV